MHIRYMCTLHTHPTFSPNDIWIGLPLVGSNSDRRSTELNEEMQLPTTSAAAAWYHRSGSAAAQFGRWNQPPLLIIQDRPGGLSLVNWWLLWDDTGYYIAQSKNPSASKQEASLWLVECARLLTQLLTSLVSKTYLNYYMTILRNISPINQAIGV